MAISDDQIQKIENAIVSPNEEEHFQDRGLRRRSVDQQIKAYQFAKDQQLLANGTPPRRQIRLHGGEDL